MLAGEATTKTNRQTATICGATLHHLYATLIDSKRHATLASAPAKIEDKVGAAWRAYGKQLSGTQLVPIKDRPDHADVALARVKGPAESRALSERQ